MNKIMDNELLAGLLAEVDYTIRTRCDVVDSEVDSEQDNCSSKSGRSNSTRTAATPMMKSRKDMIRTTNTLSVGRI